jgi:ketosteroid isomerase-like protein
MYKTAIRALLRHSITKLNSGDPSLFLKLAAPDVGIAFPGDNSWAAMYRPVVKGRQLHTSHRGIEECRGFAQRFVDNEIRFAIEDILVNGPPWNTRIALRVHDYIEGPDGTDRYNNRAVAFLTIRWGRLVHWEDYEDTERIAAWDLATQRGMDSEPAADHAAGSNG